MNDFDPGEGWREVQVKDAPHKGYLYFNEDGQERWWVREEPVPPLPTEPYTVIRADIGGGSIYEYVLVDGKWRHVKSAVALKDSALIVGFEVLSEPRGDQYGRGYIDGTHNVESVVQQTKRDTAKAVLDRVRDRWNGMWRGPIEFDDVAREFGVQS